MREFMELFWYLDSDPIRKLIALAILAIVLTPIFWIAVLLYLHFFLKYFKK